MSFLITRRPEKLFSPSVKLSRWTALGNPYIFEFTRADYDVINTAIRTAYHPTLPTIWTNADPLVLPLTLFAGQRIYVNSGVYNGVYTVHSVVGEYVTIDTPFIGNGSSGWINLIDLLTNFKAYVKIYDGVTSVLIDTVYPKPDSTGLLLCDVSGVIRSIVDTQATINQTNINKANKGISGSFKIGYGATYRYVIGETVLDGATVEVLPSNKQIYYWVSASRQVNGDTSLGIAGIGQNMKEYVPKNLIGSAAKFLTMFERPTYFEGFPFFLSFLYDEDFNVNYLERHQQDVDINGVNVGTETNNNLLVSERGYVNTMKIRTPNNGAKSFDVWLETGDIITDGYVQGGGVQLGAGSNFAGALIP